MYDQLDIPTMAKIKIKVWIKRAVINIGIVQLDFPSNIFFINRTL